MRHDKKTITLYLSEKLVTRCHELHINISEMVGRILLKIVEQPGVAEEDLDLAILLAEREKRRIEIERYKVELKPLEERLRYLDERIQKQQVLVEEIHRSEKIADAMKALNVKIRETNFDLPKTKEIAGEEIGQLKSLGMTIDDAWLQRQIDRIARLTE